MTLIPTLSFAQSTPEYLKGGEITVTLKDGKSYKFSADEYAVVKRNTKSAPSPAPAEPKNTEVVSAPRSEAHKVIVSLELARGQKGIQTSDSSTKTTIEAQSQYGLGVQLQLRVTEDVYIGGRIDANNAGAISVGKGF